MKPCMFCIVFQVIFKDSPVSVMLCLSSKALLYLNNEKRYFEVYMFNFMRAFSRLKDKMLAYTTIAEPLNY